ncbi:MAG: hypothetical protein PVG49_18020 [Desulfobacteraceae bacterium]|jgi:hypothetical protein
MRLPEIGEVVTTEWALELCRDFGLEHLAERIKADPEAFQPWRFDGCSCLPDEMLGILASGDWRQITYECCLPHDLAYAYGEPGNKDERRRSDRKLERDLIERAGMAPWIAAMFHAGVRAGGSEELGLSFSWGFARRRPSQKEE